MIKTLLLLASVVSSSSVGAVFPNGQVPTERNYQHTETLPEDTNVSVTYKYESNEVNSVDDLVEGHIYYARFPYQSNLNSYLSCTEVLLVNANEETKHYTSSFGLTDENSYFNLYINGSSLSCYIQPRNANVINRTYEQDIELLFVYRDYCNHTFIPYISYTDYNEILSVEYNASGSLFGKLSDFLDTHIFSGIPNINNMKWTIGGVEVSLKSWLVTATAISLCVFTLVLLFFFFRWVFRLVSGAILLR